MIKRFWKWLRPWIYNDPEGRTRLCPRCEKVLIHRTERRCSTCQVKWEGLLAWLDQGVIEYKKEKSSQMTETDKLKEWFIEAQKNPNIDELIDIIECCLEECDRLND